jgi:hypothetical protein
VKLLVLSIIAVCITAFFGDTIVERLWSYCFLGAYWMYLKEKETSKDLKETLALVEIWKKNSCS